MNENKDKSSRSDKISQNAPSWIEYIENIFLRGWFWLWTSRSSTYPNFIPPPKLFNQFLKFIRKNTPITRPLTLTFGVKRKGEWPRGALKYREKVLVLICSHLQCFPTYHFKFSPLHFGKSGWEIEKLLVTIFKRKSAREVLSTILFQFSAHDNKNLSPKNW